eukprot:EG_transcript_16101
MFYDLNVPTHGTAAGQRQALAAMAERLGYTGIAWNYVHQSGPPPPPQQSIPLCKVPHLQQLRRITFIPRDAQSLDDMMRSSNVEQYDMVAVVVSETGLFHKCIGHDAVDVLSIDWSRISDAEGSRWPFSEAMKKGISFELTYNPALHDPHTRAAFSQAGQRLTAWTRRRHVVLSSGATDAFQLRAPLDVAAMAVLFGVDFSTARHFVGSSAAVAVRRAAARHFTIPHHVQVIPTPGSPAEEAGGAGAAEEEEGLWVVDCGGLAAGTTPAAPVPALPSPAVPASHETQRNEDSALPRKKRKRPAAGLT